jgi:hypothetical protein
MGLVSSEYQAQQCPVYGRFAEGEIAVPAILDRVIDGIKLGEVEGLPIYGN